MKVRTRLAPSPTGDPHVGTAYQALFGFVWARVNGGDFVLRIEDTDQDRSTDASELAILESLRWIGITWDEGPDVGGPFGPYRQSDRLSIYRNHIDQLIKNGHAYPCFCSKERLDEVRKKLIEEKAPNRGYDRRCRDLSPREAAEKIAAGETYVVRMKIPLEGECVFHDLLRGEIRKDWASIDDQVIMKADGFPTYHLAVVVDDHLMEITHIIRGEEWINSVPKHVLLYEFFGWEPPLYCHLPLLRNPDKSKLSKRKNPTSINYYRKAGYLPEALLNYLGMMGWHMPDGSEKFSVPEMIKNFSLKDISLGSPVFDRAKLRWLNSRYIREDNSVAELSEKLQEWALNPEYISRVSSVVASRLETLSDWGYFTAMFFSDSVPVTEELLEVKDMEKSHVIELLQVTLWKLEELREWNSPAISSVLKEVSELFELKLKDLTSPLYGAICGSKVAPPLFDSMEVLGSDLCRTRITSAMGVLGGLSGKKLKKLEKKYRA
ncbi:MAG: glutamate--tRNA ligase [Candidatus Sabulitectum sp.]|nr:glutamate--tRNA ligase [Candidatus Sabulitectum sp.]